MSDAAIAEEPIEPVPPAPEAAAELEAVVPGDRLDQAAQEGEASSGVAEFAGASTSQLVVDHFIDSEGDQTIAQIIAGLGGTVSRNTVESAVRRLHEGGRLLRVAPGTYRLGPEKPAEPSKPPPPPPDEAALFDALERWATDASSWDVAAWGPPPNDPASQISVDVRTRFLDRVRKREARRKDAEAAAAKQAEADRKLRDQLIAATHGGYTAGPALDDVAPIRAALELVSLDRILFAIRYKTDKKLDTRNEPARSWREERLLKAIAEFYCRFDLVPRMVAAWSAAGTTPQKPGARGGGERIHGVTGAAYRPS